ncbi:hypothetical protein ACN38_g11602 [Penicillium nordicum]|uniref:Uncharacterized protein n=1 Tax=Penicillium nordicum TaxID=229535 RepID=A0A0M8NZY2_9EURO|nr:hypothetical protein ACN38_g11602 [Penicillium nordicum]
MLRKDERERRIEKVGDEERRERETESEGESGRYLYPRQKAQKPTHQTCKHVGIQESPVNYSNRLNTRDDIYSYFSVLTELLCSF